MSENDVSYVPHNLSEEKDIINIKLNHKNSSEIDNKKNDIYTVVVSTEGSLMEKSKTDKDDDEVIKIVNSTINQTELQTTTPLDNRIPNYEPTTSTDASVVETSTGVENAIERAPEKQETTTPEVIKAEDLTVKSVFTSWSTWSSCSRSCGGGVKSQSRRCVKRT